MSSLISKVSDTVFGKPQSALQPLQDFKPTPFVTRGLSGTFADNTFRITPSAGLTNAVSGVQTAATNRANEFRSLIPTTSGAFGRITEAGTSNIRDRARRAIGNLRENLAQRRVAGSSFAVDKLAQAEAEFAKQEEEFRAKTALEEIDATARLIDASTQSEMQAAQVALNQLNFESELGANINTQISQIMAQNAALQSQVLTDFASARGSLVGSVVGGVTTGLLAS